MISTTEAALKKRAKSWQTGLERPSTVEKSRSAVGGGSLPGETMPSWVLSLDCQGTSADEVMRRLREGSVPVIARIEEDRVLLDPRTVLPEEDGPLLDALRSAVAD
jgi:L-seryl-tRNA(Ser) seleniumtransferase